MKKEFPILDLRLPIDSESAPSYFPPAAGRQSQITNAFTLIEVMVVVTLLSFIVLALMAVFNSTQSAFRASITQTDVLESGRAAMDMIADDLRGMSPSLGNESGSEDAVNFYANTNQFQYLSQSAPLVQPLLASSGQSRTNVLENFFILSRGNVDGVPTWTGTGYYVDTAPASGINPLYRYSMSTNLSAANGPWWLFYYFTNAAFNHNFTGMSRLMDGVVTLRVRAYDPNGLWLTNGYGKNQFSTAQNVRFLPPGLGEVGMYMFSNTLPASVEVDLATLEDRTLQRAESLTGANQSAYLAQQAGKVHVFRQRVAVPNCDPSAYQ